MPIRVVSLHLVIINSSVVNAYRDGPSYSMSSACDMSETRLVSEACVAMFQDFLTSPPFLQDLDKVTDLLKCDEKCALAAKM